jgi:hypothetical protein
MLHGSLYWSHWVEMGEKRFCHAAIERREQRRDINIYVPS